MAEAVIPTTDPRWKPHENLSAIDRFFLARIRDEKDLIFPRTAFMITVIVLPFAALLYALPSWATFALALPYWGVVFLGLCGRYTLMLHATCHRVLFKREHYILQRWIPWFIGPFFGMTPTSFFSHHIGMHHPENNLEPDLSSTIGYKRDSFLHFIHYWARFFFLGYFHTTKYFLDRSKRKLARTFILGEISWFVAVIPLLWLDWAATLVVFVFPMFLIRFFMMCGNWAQHAFVDIRDPGNPYRNSTCLTNTRYNHKAYNDGYHIVHHIKPSLHWTEMAQWYEDNIEEFGKNDAIVFSGVGDNQMVFWNLMTGRYGWLADRLVDLPGQKERTRDEKIAWLKSRVQTPAYGMKGMLESREAPVNAVPAR